MTLAEQLMSDLAASMKAGDTQKTGVVRLLRSSVKNEEIKLGRSLDEAEILKVIQREAKQRRDSIDQYQTAGRDDLVAVEQAELDVIQTYLPKAMSQAEIEGVIDEVIASIGATSPAQMGQVIGQVMARVGTRAEGSVVSNSVKAKLSQ